MVSLRQRNRPGFAYQLKVHSFRTLTVILAWVLIVAAFYQRPELLTGAQRLMQRGIEAAGDAVPPPWGPRMEFVFREIGGLVWLQITLVVLVLRLAFVDYRRHLAGYRAAGSGAVGPMKLTCWTPCGVSQPSFATIRSTRAGVVKTTRPIGSVFPETPGPPD
jgi:hypothetical protein